MTAKVYAFPSGEEIKTNIKSKQKKILEDFDPTDRTKNAHGGLIDILKL